MRSHFAAVKSRSQSLRAPWPAVGKLELGEQPFQACAIDADCAVKPDEHNSVVSFVISKWLPPELLFSDCWSRGTKTLETRLAALPKGHSQLAHMRIRYYFIANLHITETV